MIRGGLKDFLTITTMVIFHQAAREGNRREVSLEAPLNATRATSTAESAVYQMAATGCSFSGNRPQQREAFPRCLSIRE
jgi:hypothetical protein